MRNLCTLIRKSEVHIHPKKEDESPNFQQSCAMTTSQIFARSVNLLTQSSIDPDLWNHPMLDLYQKSRLSYTEREPLLYSLTSTFGEEFDPEFAPQPTSASDLPELEPWILKFAISVLEIWAAKRQPAQLARWCHHGIYAELARKVGSQKSVGHIRKLHQCQPLDGISESVLTVRFEDRIRSMAMRFEGIDHRWLCTSLTLL